MYANALACKSTIPGFFMLFDEVDKVKVDDYNYYLTSTWNVGVGHNSKAFFTFYECDASSTKCQVIQEKLYHIDEDEYDAMKGELVFHPKNRTVSFVIDGQTILTHHPS